MRPAAHRCSVLRLSPVVKSEARGRAGLAPRALLSLGALVILGQLGCAGANSGWARTDARTCDAAARVCVAAAPDRGATFEAGGEGLLPGECAVPPGDTEGPRWVRVSTHGAPELERRRLVRASGRRLSTVVLEAPASGRARMVVERQACPVGQPVEAYEPAAADSDAESTSRAPGEVVAQPQ